MPDETPNTSNEAPAPNHAQRPGFCVQWWSVLLAAVGALCVAFIGGLIFKTLLPSPSSTYPLASFNQFPNLNVRQFPASTPLPPANAPDRPRVWEVYFDNGRPTLVAEQRLWLSRLAKLLSECDALQLTITGVVSSASYPPPDADEKNLQLARARATFVRQLVAELAPKATLIEHAWADYASLDTRRYFRDLRRASRVEHAAEFLNRRVDIELSPQSKCPLMIQALEAPLPESRATRSTVSQ